MGSAKLLIRTTIVTYMIIGLKVTHMVQAYPVGKDVDTANRRMLKPPIFPFGGIPPGYTSSAILCPFFAVPYVGGWAGRSCMGPIPPFRTPPTTPSTTTAAPMTAAPDSGDNDSDGDDDDSGQNQGQYQNPYADYGSPIEGNPWEPDDDSIFIESYGRRASNPAFRLGDPNA